MKFDAVSVSFELAEAARRAARSEADGCDGWFVSETSGDPFLALALAASSTSGITLGTNVAVAFARSPMDVAYSANDLQALSGGRFMLGLGTQVRAHIERRFSMEWGRPAARMREYVEALRAIWRAWETGEELDFEGEFYRHTLMTPFFRGCQHGHGPPQVAIAAVGPLMAEVAGAVGDAILCNPFTTPRYVRDVSIPAVTRGTQAAGRPDDAVSVAVSVFVVTGRTEEERRWVEDETRARIAFYASTPAYRRVLEVQGLTELHDELVPLAREQRWSEMGQMVDGDVLDHFAIVSDNPLDVGPKVAERWGELADRVSVYPIWEPTIDDVATIASSLGSVPVRR